MNLIASPQFSTPEFSLYVIGILPGATRREAEKKAVERLVVRVYGTKSRIGHHPDGSPFIAGHEDKKISLSHSRHRCVLAEGIDVESIGVDIEEPRLQLFKVQSKFLTAAERRMVESCEDDCRLRLLTMLWTAKEAVYKAALTPGLSLTEIEVDLSGKVIAAISAANAVETAANAVEMAANAVETTATARGEKYTLTIIPNYTTEIITIATR